MRIDSWKMDTDTRLLCPVGVVVASAAFFGVLSAERLSQIAGQDEILHYVSLGETLYQHGFSRPDHLIVFSPHLYGFILWFSHEILGPGIFASRLPGVLCWITASLSVYVWLGQKEPAFEGRGRGRLAILTLLCTMPLAVQAGAIVDIDNTILVPVLLSLVFAICAYGDEPNRRYAALVAVLFAISLWCRLTTPLLVAGLGLSYAYLRNRSWHAAFRLAVSLLFGGMLFVASWGFYCLLTGVSFAGPFNYFVQAFILCTVGSNRGVTIRRIFLSALYTVFWIGPAVCLLWLHTLWHRGAAIMKDRRIDQEDLLLVVGIAVLGGYCVVGGTIFGFPKYHCPAVPVLLAAVGVVFRDKLLPSKRTEWYLFGLLLLTSFFVQVWLIGDPLLVLRVDLREALLAGRSGRSLLVWKIIFPYLIAIILLGGQALWVCGRRQLRLSTAFVALALGMNVGLVAVQQMGGYQTGYNYGDRGDAKQAAALLDNYLEKGESAVVPGEVVYLLNRPAVKHIPNEWWLDEEALEAALARPQNAAAACSLFTNTIAQLKTFIAVAEADKGYVRVPGSGYIVFLRMDRNALLDQGSARCPSDHIPATANANSSGKK